MKDPRPVYSQLLDERRADIVRRERRHRMLGYCQLVMAACGVAIILAALVYQAVSIFWAVVPVAAVMTLARTFHPLLRVLKPGGGSDRDFRKSPPRPGWDLERTRA